MLKQWSRARERCCMLISPPSACLPRSLLPPRPPSSALPPPACGAPSFPAGPPPPPPASCSLAFPRVLPATGKWNPATAIASLAGREPPRSSPRASFAGPGRKRAAGGSRPALLRHAPRAGLRRVPTPGRLLGVGRGPALSLPPRAEEAQEPAFLCPLAVCWWVERAGQRVRTQANSRRAKGQVGQTGVGREWRPERQGRPLERLQLRRPALGRLPPHRPLAARSPLHGSRAAGEVSP